MQDRRAGRIEEYVAFCLESECAFERAQRAKHETKVAARLQKLYGRVARSFPRAIGRAAADPDDFRGWTRRAADGQLTIATFSPWLASAPAQAFAPRLLLEATNTLRYGHTNGIQRVVRELAKCLVADGSALPIVCAGDGSFAADVTNGELTPLRFQQGDILFLADTTWIFDKGGAVSRAIESVKAHQGKIVVCLYDIIPLLHPTFFVDDLSTSFKVSLERLVPSIDGIVTNSRASAGEIEAYLEQHFQAEQARIPVRYFHLGADIKTSSSDATSSRLLGLEGRSYFLCVGTVEPRKGHLVALRAFELLWARGVDVDLVIMGGKGWKMNFLEHRLSTHAEFGRRLHRFDRVSDDELISAYEHAVAVIMPTLAEGFGLPVVEAASLGAPVIASDIPVLREVGGDSVYYFDPLDDAHLAARVEEVLETDASRRKVLSGALGWQEATVGFTSALASLFEATKPS